MALNVNNYFKKFCISILLIISFRAILDTPIDFIGRILEVIIYIGSILFFFVYALDLIIKKAVKPIHFLGAFLCILPPIAAISANLEFNQPLTFGILAQRDYFLVLSPYIILYLLETKVITLKLLEQVFASLCWLFLITFFLVNTFVDPAPYVKTGIVGFKELKGGYIFRFQMIFILFGSLYYLIKGLEHKKLLYYFYSSLFVFYIILIRQDRTIVFFLILTIVILLLKRLSLKRVISFSLISGLLISFFIYYGNLIKHDSINQLNDLYYQTYLNLFSDDIPKENVDVRWQELETASKYIKKNPIWGSGELSKQWNNGFERLGHFYPADIGIFGFLFIYGIGGFLIACTQVFYFILLNRRTASKNNVFVATLKYSILLFYLNSFSDGSLMQRTAIGMTMIIILYYYSQQSIQVKNEKI